MFDILTYAGYDPGMRTTVRLSDPLLERARKEAARRGTTLTALIEEGLLLVLAGAPMRPDQQERVRIPVSQATGGTLPGVDLDRSSELLDLIEGRA